MGVVAAGHPLTAEVAAEILRAGGNAFDAVVSAAAAACITEPVLSSLGGGGFLLAEPASGDARIYDFFCQTPMQVKPADALDFVPVHADFGTTLQEFHTGRGASATPGMVAGLAQISAELGRMTLKDALAPAIEMAREGVVVNRMQAFILEAVAPIMLHSTSTRALYASRTDGSKTLQEGERLVMGELAGTLDALTHEGADLFYKGDVAQMIAREAGEGGLLSLADLAAYEVIRRKPLEFRFAGQRVMTNPPPSSGGTLIAYCMALIERLASARSAFRDAAWFATLASVMESANQARRDVGLIERNTDDKAAHLMAPNFVAAQAAALTRRAVKTGGTTHISVLDSAGNVAAMSVSNGEGAGHMLATSGIMLNNMLGEEDINPSGFFNWAPNSRITSMMSPTIVERADGGRLGLGSGGSNRIRTAILQVLLNCLAFELTVDDAVEASRIHCEGGVLHVEGGHPQALVDALQQRPGEVQLWPDRNFFFGGVHAAAHEATGNAFQGAGDPRRGGAVVHAA